MATPRSLNEWRILVSNLQFIRDVICSRRFIGHNYTTDQPFFFYYICILCEIRLKLTSYIWFLNCVPQTNIVFCFDYILPVPERGEAAGSITIAAIPQREPGSVQVRQV